MTVATIRLTSPDEVGALGTRLAAVLRVGDVILIDGALGAGKTTLARGLLRGLALAGEAPSPTFAIVQPYAPPEVSLPVAHVDLYRLDGPEEVAELGLDEWLDNGALVIEWPDRLGGLFDAIALRLHLEVAADGARLLTAHLPAAWEGRWPRT